MQATRCIDIINRCVFPEQISKCCNPWVCFTNLINFGAQCFFKENQDKSKIWPVFYKIVHLWNGIVILFKSWWTLTFPVLEPSGIGITGQVLMARNTWTQHSVKYILSKSCLMYLSLFLITAKKQSRLKYLCSLYSSWAIHISPL